MNKGMAMQQMAVLILVILGLTVMIIVATTQFRSGASSISSLGQVASSGAETGSESARQTFNCEYYGYECRKDCGGKQEHILECADEEMKCCAK